MHAEWPDSPSKPLPANGPLVADPGILAEITAGLSTGNDMEALLRRFLVPIMQMAGAKAGAVRVLSPKGDRLQMISEAGLPDHVALARLSQLAADSMAKLLIPCLSGCHRQPLDVVVRDFAA